MTHRVEQLADGVTLHLGDCREILPTLGSVDHVITDPPYSANTHQKAKTNKVSANDKQLVTFSSLTDASFAGVVDAALAVARGWVVLTCDYRHAALMYGSPSFVRLGVWVKPNPMPQISADRPGQGFETVLILHAGKQPKAWNRGGGAGIWTVPVVNGALVPTQKPLRLVSAFVDDFTRSGDVICDPFMGSGTTGLAAVQQGRDFVGIEANDGHFDVACRRISDELKRPRLFAEPPPAYRQEALL